MLFVILMILVRLPRYTGRPGILTGVFIGGYGLARFIVEMFREPDAHLGVLQVGVTMGQVLSIPMIIAGLLFFRYAVKKGPAQGSS